MKGQTIELEIHNKLGMIANKLRQNRQCPTSLFVFSISDPNKMQGHF